MPRDGDLTPGLDDMWLSPSEIAEARLPGLPSTRGRVREMAERLGWTAPEREGAAWRQRVGRGGGVEINARCLPLAAQAKLLRHMPEAPLPAGPSQEADAAVAERWAWFDRQPERLKAKARARMKIMMRLRELLGAHRSRAYAIGLLLQEHRHDKGADPRGRLGVLRHVPASAQLIARGEVVALATALVCSAERRPDCRLVPGFGDARTEAERADCIHAYRQEVEGLLRALPGRAA